jgi:hypothetical protein
MTTAADLIQDAALWAGVGDQYNPLDGTSVATGLRLLNRMLDNWSLEGTPLFNIVDSQGAPSPTPGWTLTPGQSVYTIGPANLVGVRPTEINSIFLNDTSGVSYYLRPIQADEYARLIYKPAPGRPDRFYPNWNETTLTLTFYPTPAYADVVHMLYLYPLLTVATPTLTMSLPMGYEECIVSNLAVRWCILMGKPVPPDLRNQASWSKGQVNQSNVQKYELQNPMPTQKRRFFNILTGGTV